MIRRIERLSRPVWGSAAVVALICIAALINRPEANPEDLALGRMLFKSGVVGSSALTGHVGADRIPLEGDLVACARCHGERGGGGRGGEAAPPIHARALYSAVPGGNPDRPARPAYDRKALVRAIRDGRSADGRALSWIMPRFDLDGRQLDALIAYLEVVEKEASPGVGRDSVVIGSALPSEGRLAAAAQDVRDVLQAAFAEVNASGGIFGRRVELRVMPPQGEGEEIFAFAASIYAQPSLTDERLEREGIPLIAPMGLEAADQAGPIFSLLPGVADQARWAVQQFSSDVPIVVVHSRDTVGRAWAEAVEEECARRVRPRPTVIEVAPGALDPADLTRRLVDSGAGDVLVALPAPALAALVSSSRGELRFIAPGVLARLDLPLEPTHWEKLRFVYPATGAPDDGVPAELREFLSRHGLKVQHVAFQAHALAAARVLIEGLRRAGANPTRSQLVSAIEELQDFETGVTPSLTFGRGRHVGAQGARWVRLDPGTRAVVAASDWVALSP